MMGIYCPFCTVVVSIFKSIIKQQLYNNSFLLEALKMTRGAQEGSFNDGSVTLCCLTLPPLSPHKTGKLWISLQRLVRGGVAIGIFQPRIDSKLTGEVRIFQKVVWAGGGIYGSRCSCSQISHSLYYV